MINQAEERIFSQWMRFFSSEQDGFFVKDGVVNPNEWSDTPFNVLFLLKEVNGGDNAWDERDYLNNYFTDERYISTHSPSIDSILLLIYGIFHCSSKTPWEQVIAQNNSKHKEWLLRQIALVNIKKTPGQAVAEMKTIDEFFELPYNQMYLKQQLDLYEEDIDLVICGGTAYYLQQLDSVFSAKKWKTTVNGIKYLRIKNTIYLDFVHPLARVPKNFLFYNLLIAIENIEKSEHLQWSEHRNLPTPDEFLD